MLIPLLILAALCAPALSLLQAPKGPVNFVTDVDKAAFPAPASGPGISINTMTGISRGKAYTAHVATIADPRFFSIEIPQAGVPSLAKTSDTAAFRGCAFATNGGFFDMSTGAPEGNVIINGTIVNAVNTMRANFGMIQGAYVTGYIPQASLAGWNFTQLLQGVGWVVRGGLPYVNASLANGEVSLGFVTEMAPRTAVGYNSAGHLLLVVFDGEEDIDAGADLYTVEDVMIQAGAVSAVNLDGGGSSVAVYKGKWVSHPTCDDTHTACERAVSTITCVA